MKADTLDALIAARRAREGRVRIVSLTSGVEALVSDPAELSAVGFGDSRGALVEVVAAVLAGDRGRIVVPESERGAASGEAESYFVHPFNPPVRLVIVGAVHIAQRLSVLAQDLGYEVLVIDPRRGFLTEARFPGVARSHDWPDVALEGAAKLDARSALVTLSHDPKIDNPALEVGLQSACFYIGALGSRRTQGRRRERLEELGFDETALSRIHGPVGLDIGASSPAEIALSIAAELTQCLRKRD
jgi:xanthine dehydrogenase accessory factor